jgi:hypothetical protein
VFLCAKYTSEADALVSNPNPICGQPLVLVEPMRPALASARCVNGLCSVGDSPGPHRTVAPSSSPGEHGSPTATGSPRPHDGGNRRFRLPPLYRVSPAKTCGRQTPRQQQRGEFDLAPHSPFDEVVHMHVFVTTC